MRRFVATRIYPYPPNVLRVDLDNLIGVSGGGVGAQAQRIRDVRAEDFGKDSVIFVHDLTVFMNSIFSTKKPARVAGWCVT